MKSITILAISVLIVVGCKNSAEPNLSPPTKVASLAVHIHDYAPGAAAPSEMVVYPVVGDSILLEYFSGTVVDSITVTRNNGESFNIIFRYVDVRPAELAKR
jgi:hypothetical protein